MLKGWRTLLVGVLIAGLGAIQAADLVTVIPEQYTGFVIAGIGALIVWLRSITNTPILENKP